MPAVRAALSRFLAVALLLASLGAVYLIAVEPLLARYRANAEALDDSRALLQRYRHAVAGASALRTFDARLRQTGRISAGFVVAAQKALAVAEVQGRIKRVIKQADGQLISIQVVQDRGDDPFERVTVRSQIEVETGQLLRIFRSLESGMPTLFLDNLLPQPVADRPARLRRKAAGDDTPQTQRLSARFDAYAYRWREADR